ncbi:uncharacterized protein [Musca autumnalis]|uniref:uncharacterized protein n=1 Tax=Musca autumnalis TaxID=221902 RepID=UPI003CFB2791
MMNILCFLLISYLNFAFNRYFTMAGSNVCRLCRTSCNDSIRLRNANGTKNEIYTITIKFFHPTFLEIEKDNTNSIAVLCMQCWHHISGFNNFQQTVSLLHANLQTVADNVIARGQLQPNPCTSDNNLDDFPQEIVLKKEIKSDPDTITIVDGHSEATVAQNDEGIPFQIDNAIHVAEEFSDEEHGDIFIVDELNDDFDYSKYSDDPLLKERSSAAQSSDSDDQIDIPASRKNRKSQKEIDAVIAKWRPLLKCESCSKPYTTFTLLKEHFLAEHPNEEFYILCCGRKLKYRFRVEEHAIIHLNPKAFKCQLCGKCFTARFTLLSHTSQQHPGAKFSEDGCDYSYKCSLCGLCCGDEATLREHCNIHTNTKMYHCMYCNKSFKQESGLIKHLASYHPDKHVDQGQSSKITKCPFCPRTFNYRTGLYHHERRCHPAEFAKRTRRRRNNKKTHTLFLIMAGPNVCRLCRQSCTDSIRLRNANGTKNEIYTITIKFFHPTFLQVEKDNTNAVAVLCMQCWHHISGFNNFQQTVSLLHANLHTVAESVIARGQLQPDPGTSDNNVDDFPQEIDITKEIKREEDVPGTITIEDDNLEATQKIEQFPVPQNEESIPFQIENPMHVDEEFTDEEGCDIFIVDELKDDVEYSNCSDDPLHRERSSAAQSPDTNDEINVSSSKKNRKSQAEMDEIIAKWRPYLKCESCSNPYTTFTLLKEHFLAEHPNEEFYILCCGRKLKYRFRVEEHAILHLNPKAFKCQLCGKCFTTRFTLLSHTNKKHPSAKFSDDGCDYRYKCSLCGLRCADEATLREHCNIHKSLKDKSGVNQHLASTHTDKHNNQGQPERFIQCPHCPRTFNYRTGTYHHEKKCHPEEFAKRTRRRRNNIKNYNTQQNNLT